MKLFWTGTDVLFMNTIPPGTRLRFKIKILAFRYLAKIMQSFIEANYVVSEHLLSELNLRKMEVMPDRVKYSQKYKKVRHKGIKVLYYHPKDKNNPKFIRWLYGIDIIDHLKVMFPEVLWIRADGTMDLSKIFPFVDYYVRPNRHDGHPRLIDECIINEIPYYWSKSDPDSNEIIKGLTNIIKGN